MRVDGSGLSQYDMTDLANVLAHPDVERLARVLRSRTPARLELPGSVRHAAVVLMLRLASGGRLELLLIKRAEYGGDPWSGHIALPGGRQEPADHTLLATVVRETREEIGVDLTIHGSMLGELDELQPRTFQLPPIGILPHVAVVESSVELSLSEEVALAFWVPVEALQDPAASREIELQLAGGPRRFPSFGYQSHVIWGLTERILRQFLDLLIQGDGDDAGAR